MLQEEFFLLGEEIGRCSEDGAQRGGHLQGDQQKHTAPEDERPFLTSTGKDDYRFEKTQREHHGY